MRRVFHERPIDHEVARIAASQRGLVTRAQLLAAGLGKGGIEHRLAVGRLHRVLRGVYAVGHPALPPGGRQMAALLACGEGAVLSHRSAAIAWRLLPDFEGPVELTVVGSSLRTRRELRVHRTAVLEPTDKTIRNGLPLTAAPRTLLDLAEVADSRELELAVATAQTRKLVSHERLTAYVAANATGRRGAAPLRALLRREGGPAFTRSGGERHTLALIRAARLPPPRANAKAAGYEVDFLWPTERLAVEMDSYEFHSSRQAFERDHRKTTDLETAGYRVRRFTARQVNEEPHAVVAVIATALAHGPPR